VTRAQQHPSVAPALRWELFGAQVRLIPATNDYQARISRAAGFLDSIHLYVYLKGAHARLKRVRVCRRGIGKPKPIRWPGGWSGWGRLTRCDAGGTLPIALNPLDEPTSAQRAARGLTYLFVSHNLAVIAHMCSQVAIMKAGAIVEQVPTAALRTGALADPYSRQLLKSSEGYDRQAAAALVSYD